MRFPVPGPVLEAISRLNDGGYAAYLVGGCVRDDFLNIQPHDYDICTSALPDEIKRCFEGEKILETGLKHGTLTLMIDHLPIEITTFRSDGTYTDGRHPDQVTFTPNLQEDLLRRDFTINAMAWHPASGLVDLFGGQEDCKQRLIRCVGDAKQRFSEDALRILRALRFACVLGFSIEGDTANAMNDKMTALHHLSIERITAELNKMMVGQNPADLFREYPRIFFEVLPSLIPMFHCPQRSVFHCFDVWEHTLHALAYTPPILAVRWAALYHDSGKPAAITYDPDGATHFRGHQAISARIVEETMLKLKQPKALTEEIKTLVKYHDERIGPDNLQYWLSKLGAPLFFNLVHLQRADMAAHAPHVAAKIDHYDMLTMRAEELCKNGTCLSLHDLAVDGKALVEIGFTSDPFLGETLHYLLDRVVNGFEPNDRNTLLSVAKKRLGERGK